MTHRSLPLLPIGLILIVLGAVVSSGYSPSFVSLGIDDPNIILYEKQQTVTINDIPTPNPRSLDAKYYSNQIGITVDKTCSDVARTKTYDVYLNASGVRIGTFTFKIGKYAPVGTYAGSLSLGSANYGASIFVRQSNVPELTITELRYTGDTDDFIMKKPSWGPLSAWSSKTGIGCSPAKFVVTLYLRDLPDVDGDGFNIGWDIDDNDRFITTWSDMTYKIKHYFITKEEIDRLQGEYDSLISQYQDLQGERDGLVVDIQSLNDNIGNLNAEIQGLNTQILSKNQELEEIRLSLDITATELQTKNQELATLTEIIRLGMTEIILTHNDIVAVELENQVLLSDMIGNLDELKANYNGQIESIDTLLSIITEKKTEINGANLVTIPEQEQDILIFLDQLEKAISNLKTQTEDSKAVLIELENQIIYSQQLQEDMIEQSTLLNTQIENQISTIAELDLTVGEQAQEIDYLMRQIDNLQDRIVEQGQLIAKEKDFLIAQEQEILVQEQKIQELQTKHLLLDSKVEELLSKNAELERELERQRGTKSNVGGGLILAGLVLSIAGVTGKKKGG